MTITFYNGSSITSIDSLDTVRSRGYRIDDIEWIKDDVGGLHSEGMGWKPTGEFCGECCDIDCSECISRKKDELKPKK